jgi:hypothetical protein
VILPRADQRRGIGRTTDALVLVAATIVCGRHVASPRRPTLNKFLEKARDAAELVPLDAAGGA